MSLHACLHGTALHVAMISSLSFLILCKAVPYLLQRRDHGMRSKIYRTHPWVVAA